MELLERDAERAALEAAIRESRGAGLIAPPGPGRGAGGRRVPAAWPRECVRPIEPGGLAAEAVALLARRGGRDASELHAVSGGNPFFVPEVLAAPAGDGVPASV